jgi:putative ABC transport system substrate-binding protein
MGKQLELFKEAMPTISRVAVLVDPAHPIADRVPSNMTREARELGVQLQRVEAGGPEAFEAAFTAMVQGGADAVLIMDGTLFATHRQRCQSWRSGTACRPCLAGGTCRSGEFAGLMGVCLRAVPAPAVLDKILNGAKPRPARRAAYKI